jgi:hypothetical protein
MLLLYPAVVALMVSLLRGGSLRGLATLPLRGTQYWVLALAVEVTLYLPGLRTSAFAARWGGLLYLIAMGLALWGGLRNWHLGPWARLAVAGLGLNVAAIVVNGGYMPVNVGALRAGGDAALVRAVTSPRLYENTRPMGAGTRLAILGDRFAMHLPVGPGNAYSVGDLLLAAGMAGVVYDATRRLCALSAARPRPSSAPETR